MEFSNTLFKDEFKFILFIIKKLRKFYNIFKRHYSKWIQVVQKEEKTHPYKKFERENDKLYKSFLKRTENFE